MSMEISSIISGAAAPIVGAVLGIIFSLIPILKESAESNWKKLFT